MMVGNPRLSSLATTGHLLNHLAPGPIYPLMLGSDFLITRFMLRISLVLRLIEFFLQLHPLENATIASNALYSTHLLIF